MRYQAGIMLGVLIVPVLAGCRREPLSGPPEVRFGRDMCAECGMIVSDALACGAILVEAEGVREHRLFDDLGCMLDHEVEHASEMSVLEAFTVDHNDGGWLRTQDAVFLLADISKLMTPMGSGYVSFRDHSTAARAQERFGGRVTDAEGIAAARAAWRESVRRPAGDEPNEQQENSDGD